MAAVCTVGAGGGTSAVADAFTGAEDASMTGNVPGIGARPVSGSLATTDVLAGVVASEEPALALESVVALSDAVD